MDMNIRKSVLLVFALIFFAGDGVAGVKSAEGDKYGYLKDRILNSNVENVLVPFTESSSSLSFKGVEDAKSAVWSLWKEVNDEFEKLPSASNINGDELVLHSWELIDEDPMPFYYIKKVSDVEENLKPLFLNLHGSGSKFIEFPTTLKLSESYKDVPSVYFIPQIPSERRYRWWYQPVQNAWEKLFRLAMLNDEIDANRIHIIGISEGGYGSQRLGAYYADYLAGVGPMAGGEPLKNAPPLNYRHVAFSFHTGEHDRMFGRNELTALAGSVFDSLATVYPGEFVHNIVIQNDKGHAVDYSLTTPWLVDYTRNIAPMNISWVHFPMHNRYRKGFYNVAMEVFPNIKEEDKFNRILFDIRFDKKKNVVTIDASLMDDEMNELKEIDNGRIALFLDERYVNLKKKVKVVYNGDVVFNNKLKLDESNLIESCGLFGDPERLFPAKVSINL